MTDSTRIAAPPIIAVDQVSRQFVKPLDLAEKILRRFGADLHEEVVHAVDRVDLSIIAGEVVGMTALLRRS